MSKGKKKDSQAKKVTRREFIKTTACAGVAMTVPGIFNLLSKSAYAQSSKKTLRVVAIPHPKITPGQMTSGPAANVVGCIYDYLFRLEGKEQKFTYSLAESTEHSSDMTQWTFKLREKVKFHHGTEFTADDVIFTVNRYFDKTVASPMRAMFEHIDKIEKKDRYLVRFLLKRPDPDFLLKFLEYNTAMLAHDYDYNQFGNTKPSGTGAYKVVNMTPGQRVYMERNPDYFIRGFPKVDNLEFILIQEPQTQLMTVEAGQADIMTWVPFDFLSRSRQNPELTLQGLPTSFHAPISMRCDQPPFNDNRVRQAMKLVVDRKMMVQTTVAGYGEVANDDFIWPKSILYNDIGIKERNIDNAKELLSKAGYPKGLDVEIHCESNKPPVMDVVLTFQQMAKPAGINVQIVGVTTDIYYAKYWLKAPVTCTSWGHRENPLDLLIQTVKTGVPWNEGHYSNPDLDKMLADALVEVDLKKRKEIVKKIQLLLSEEGPSVVPFFYNLFAVTRKRVAGFQQTRNFVNDYRFVEIV
jgi:peptide/nickel transport system substrate-binding protein